MELATVGKSPLDSLRPRHKRQDFVRVEVHVREEDAVLVHGIAEALGDPSGAAEARNLLRARFLPPTATGLKALIASAPLDGIDLKSSSGSRR